MFVTIFVNGRKRLEKDFHDKFILNGIACQVDAVHGLDADWLEEKLSETPHLFFTLDPNVDDSFMQYDTINCSKAFFRGLLKSHPPYFMVHFNQRDRIKEQDWDFIIKYLNHILLGVECERMMTRRAKTLLGGGNVQVLGNRSEEDVKFYSFDEYLQRNRDVALFQIRKPNSSLPYTTIVVREFSEKGYLPIFTSCVSWASNLADVSFMKYLWKELGFEGELDVDQLIDAHMGEFCVNPYPEVYKRSIMEVLEMFNQRDKGILLGNV